MGSEILKSRVGFFRDGFPRDISPVFTSFFKAEIEAKFREDLRDGEYTEMIDVLERLMSIDFSYKFKDFLFQYRVVSETISNREEAAKPLKDEHNRDYVENIGRIQLPYGPANLVLSSSK